ncbi:MAG: hypothetical protein LBC18_07430, partial [Opitutaceae bacterium]|nr:hypothetical protein [Opitutaceae bacterium]
MTPALPHAIPPSRPASPVRGDPQSRSASRSQAARRRRRRLFAPLACLPALLLAALAPSALRAAPPDKTNTLLLEPETFAAHGGWEIAEGNESADLTTETFIRSAGTGGTALAGFTVAAGGTYKVWALSRDYATYNPRTRRFGVWIDGTAPDAEGGVHGAEGWRWEPVKTLPLAAGPHIIEIKHIQSNGRCEALLITSADLDPGGAGVTRASLNAYTQTPRQAARVPISTAALQTPSITDGAGGVAAELQNAALTLRFRRAQTASGQNVLLREITFAAGAGDAAGRTWRAPLEPVHLIASSADPAVNVNRETRWNSAATEDWRLDGATWSLPVDPRNAFLAGDARACYLPESVIPSPAGSPAGAGVTLSYKLQQETDDDDDAGLPAEITVAWSLPETGFAARMEPSLTTVRAGWYSLAFAAAGAGGLADADVTALQLPPIYQFRRAPDVPVLLVSSLTPHPLALVETAGAGAAPLTHGVIADPGELTSEWAERGNSTHGFSLRGRENNMQPSVFAPVLGGRGSRLDAGAGLRAAWWVMTSPRPWLETMRDADTGVLKLRDYREPWAASLTTQALNMIKLMKSGPAFRWYENLKGPSNIEGATTATQSAPLMLVSAARLARDPEFYKTRGVPSLEYALSRPTWHFANSIENSFMTVEADTRLAFENRSYGAALWQGFDDLLGGLNPWLRDYMMKNGRPRSSNSGDVPVWSEKLALYRSAPSPELLAEIANDAKAWADDAFDNPPELPRRAEFFYNLQLYPYWWDLLDLYELTGDPGLITRARQGAALTVAGQWVQPVVPEDGTMTLNAGNQLTVARTQWWDGDIRGRLGWPPGWQPGVPITFDLPEHDVPAWLPATAGLGLEGPGTYFNSQGSFYNMQNTVWAANLIRLAARTGEDYWRAHARNALIGRGSNYPGYYLAGYTDVMHDPGNPDTGPDLTAFYWHHAPVHLASIIDFIFTDADARTGGAIRFPYSKSQGYVWFSSRVYGGKPGRVFDDPACWPWLDNMKFNVDTPKVDYLGAQSAEKFHSVLLNQARAAAAAKVDIDAAALGSAPG